jgi:hypothetical protein
VDDSRGRTCCPRFIRSWPSQLSDCAESAESWAAAKVRYEFLRCFDGALVSGEIGIAKPDPAFSEMLIETFALVPQETLHIEDNLTNLRAASSKDSSRTHSYRRPNSPTLFVDMVSSTTPIKPAGNAAGALAAGRAGNFREQISLPRISR